MEEELDTIRQLIEKSKKIAADEKNLPVVREVREKMEKAIDKKLTSCSIIDEEINISSEVGDILEKVKCYVKHDMTRGVYNITW